MSDTLKRVLRNLLIFAVILAVLIFLVMFALKKYTHHDSVITVPDVTTLTVEDAAPFIEKKNLRYMVVDSIRVKTQPPGAILEQKPSPGAHVKQNRIIFLTINASSEERIAIPDVKDCSQRQAVATLEATGIQVRDIEFVPSEFRDLVLGVRYNGKDISAGFKLPKGSFVTLIVGQSSSEGEILVPSMKGLFLDEAIELAHSKSMSIGDVHYDVTPPNADEAKYYQVYKQEPITGSSSSMGKKVNVWLTTDQTLIEAPEDIAVPKDSMSTE